MNPFAAFAEDDEDDFQKAPTENKTTKKSNQDKKGSRAQKDQKPKPVPSTNQNAPQRIKENNRNKRYHEVVPPKEVPAKGHYLDRHSGTGRTDRPRKEGAGRGNVGNLKDELNKDKYIKQEGQQQTEEVVEEEEKKPEEPEKMTLDEYYRQKGIEVNNQTVQREPVKKGEIKADWIQKEKLTVLQTKEDKRGEREKPHASRRDLQNKVGGDSAQNVEILGFGSKPVPEKRTEQPREYQGKGKKGGKKTEKVVIKEEEFPSL